MYAAIPSSRLTAPASWPALLVEIKQSVKPKQRVELTKLKYAHKHLVCDVPSPHLLGRPNSLQRVFTSSCTHKPSPVVGNIPLVIAGTTTGQEQLLQCRRWLGNERRVDRFAREAIAEVEKSFHKDPAVRTSHPFHDLSLEAKQIVATLETEREEAAGGGNAAADWWDGPERKGVTHAEQKAFKTQKELFKHYGLGMSELLGIDDSGLGSMMEGTGVGDGLGFADSDDDVEEGERANRGSGVGEGGQGNQVASELLEMGVEMGALEQGEEDKMQERTGEARVEEPAEPVGAQDAMDVD